MERELITEKVRGIAGAVAANAGIEVVNVEIAGTKRDAVVRIYIDKPGGVTLDDCSTVSRDVEGVLDLEDFIPSRYVLEVSSPGIERGLFSLTDFEKFSGQLVKVTLREAVDGQKTFVGPVSVDGEIIEIDDRNRGMTRFDYSAVAKAHLKIDLSKEFGARR